MTARGRPGIVVTWSAWLVSLVLLTWVFVLVRGQIDRVHVALAFLLVVLGGSATGGRALGRTLAILSYLDFHFFFVEQSHSLQVSNPADALVLIAFLVTALMAERLVTAMQLQTAIARERGAEIERLAALGAETLSAGRAEDAVRTIAEVIRSSLDLASCRLLTADEPVPPAAPGVERMTLPLETHTRRVGTLVIARHGPLHLRPEQRRFLEALRFYAALALERARLVSDAERAEADRQAEGLRRSLVAGLSHDLRTPLTAIKGYAHRAATTAPAESAAIVREADRLDRLAGDLLDLSRLDAGAMPLQPEFNTASDLVGAAMQRLDGPRAAGKLRVVPFDEGPAEPLAGRFDFVQALRCLENLVANALKYSPEDAPVEVGVAREGDALAFRVADRGPGVPEPERERVFEAFYRSPVVPPDAGGSGLGLAIARRLAREQGGDVRLEPREGGGSVFILTLPAATSA